MNNKPILIIEDDFAIRESLKDFYEAEGFKVQLAENGWDGLQMLIENKVDPFLILLDLSMPVMDGQTFLKKINLEYPSLKRYPIYIMTAAGANAIPTEYDPEKIIRKPLDIEILLQLVENLNS